RICGVCIYGLRRRTLAGGNTPGLTEQRKTPHAAATFGVLTELAGLRPPGPGAPQIYPEERARARSRKLKKLRRKAELFSRQEALVLFLGRVHLYGRDADRRRSLLHLNLR